MFVVGAAEKDVFDLKAERVRLGRNQKGSLRIDAQGIAFHSKDGEADIKIPFESIRLADLASPRSFRVETYEVRKWEPVERKEFTFRLPADKPVDHLAEFLSRRIHRPVVGHYQVTSLYQIPAYHRRSFAGTNGTLEIGETALRFVSDKPEDSRTWLYRDIETIGRPDAFRFRVTTNRETYVMELKAELPEAAYQFAWSRVYNLKGSK